VIRPELPQSGRATAARVGHHRVLRATGPSVPNVLAAVLLAVSEQDDMPSHIYFEWSERAPGANAMRFLFAGEGDIPPLTHEILRRAEPDATKRPIVHVGGYAPRDSSPAEAPHPTLKAISCRSTTESENWAVTEVGGKETRGLSGNNTHSFPRGHAAAGDDSDATPSAKARQPLSGCGLAAI
jgi:hypothetical protein